MQDRSNTTIKKAGSGAVLGGVVGAVTGYFLSGDACPAGIAAMYANLAAYPEAVKNQIEKDVARSARDIVQQYWPYTEIEHNMWGYRVPPPEGIWQKLHGSLMEISTIALSYAADTVKSPFLVCAPFFSPVTLIPQLCAMGTIIGFSAALLSNYMSSSSEVMEETKVDKQDVDATVAIIPPLPVEVEPQVERSQSTSSNPHSLFAAKSGILVETKKQAKEMRGELHKFRESRKQVNLTEAVVEQVVEKPRI